VYRIKKVKKRRRSTRAVKPERDVIIDKDWRMYSYFAVSSANDSLL
jgi:hypothetical protein